MCPPRIARALRRLRATVRPFLADCRAVSATELALLAPFVLLPGTLVPIDIAMAVYEQMAISDAVRIAAQTAIEGGRETDVRAVLAAVAAENFKVAGSASAAIDDLEISVTTVLREEDGDTLAFLQIEARKAYDGILVPMPIPLRSSVMVSLP